MPTWRCRVRNHGARYRELFALSVAAGLAKPENLAGPSQWAAVYIRGSRHVPLKGEGVRDTMPAFFDLREENDPSVRIALGRFIFV